MSVKEFIAHAFYVKLSRWFFNYRLKTFKKILISSLLPSSTILTLLGNQLQWILKGQCARFLRNFELVTPNTILVQFWLRYINILLRLSWTQQHFSLPMTSQGYHLPFFLFFFLRPVLLLWLSHAKGMWSILNAPS